MNLTQRFAFLYLFLLSTLIASAQTKDFADYVEPMIGSLHKGACSPGPCLPHGSVYPSPNTLNGNNGGYRIDEKIVGFAQLHVQGSGGHPSYGSFLVSPQIGLRTAEAAHNSSKELELAKAYYYRVMLRDYKILCEITPAKNVSLYRFTYPKSDSAVLALDVSRKIRNGLGLDNGTVRFDAAENALSGEGDYWNNWPAPEKKWKMFFYAVPSKRPLKTGIWKDDKIYWDSTDGSFGKQRAGGFFYFNTSNDEEIFFKIAVSFKSVAHAKSLMAAEMPGWDFEGYKSKAKEEWNKTLSCIKIESTEEEKTKFYTHLFHSFVQPRNRTNNNTWNTTAEYWDDHYTMWDSWKTLFPLMTIVKPEMVAGNVNSFINRFKHHRYTGEAFINGNEGILGQGGNTMDNIIADAFVKGVKGINWEDAYALLKFNADSLRTDGYKKNGFMYMKEPHRYSWRLMPASGTIAFALNDYSLAQVAKGLGKTTDYQFYSNRANNWRNTWNAAAQSDGYSGFIMAKNKDGSFNEIDPKKGYNQHFYEGTCWEYSYEIPQDVKGMVKLMGGKQVFTKRLQYAVDNHLIDFENEPSFMTPWMFCTDEIRRPDLTSYYVQKKILPLFTRYDLPGDDDQGAMASLYVFMKLGFFPFATSDKYYLHGTTLRNATINLPNGEQFKIVTLNSREENIYVKTAKLNGKILNRSWISHQEIMNGGVLQFQMVSKIY